MVGFLGLSQNSHVQKEENTVCNEIHHPASHRNPDCHGSNISGRIRNRGTGSQSGMFLYIIWKKKTKQLITAGFAHKSVGKQQSVKHVNYRTVRNHLSHIPVLLPLPIPHNNSIAYIFNDISGGLFLIYCSHAYVIGILS